MLSKGGYNQSEALHKNLKCRTLVITIFSIKTYKWDFAVLSLYSLNNLSQPSFLSVY